MIQFEQLLSQSLKKSNEERIIKPRDYLYASEIGKSFLDVWLALRGTEPTNPMDDRALRTFMVGHIFEDYIAKLLPETVKVEREKVVEFILNGYLPVHGRIDFLIDGVPIELKTVNSMSFWHNTKGEGGFKPYDHHLKQLMMYMLGLKVNDGVLVYISKDDATIQQVNVKLENTEQDKLYLDTMEWIKKMTEYHLTNTKPPAEENIVMENGKWKANWHITRSNYFTLITGKKDPHEIELEANRMNYKLKKETKG